MPARKRSDLVDPNEVGVYLCWSRCVRRMKSGSGGSGRGGDSSGPDTCGPLTENPARLHWFDTRLEALASVFAIELNEYSVLDHTVYTLLTIRPDIADRWSDDEVVRRWAKLSRKKLELVAEELTEEELQERVNDPKYVADKRKRLGDLSWFMIELKEPISLAANKEDGASGHAFAERFGCERLRSPERILQVAAEITAQAVSSGLAESPDLAKLTSYLDRLEDKRTWAAVEAPAELCDADQDAEKQEFREAYMGERHEDIPVELREKVRGEVRSDDLHGTNTRDESRCSKRHSDRCHCGRLRTSVWRPKAGWLTPGGSEGDGYDGVAVGRRVTNESHLTIDGELLDELLKKWCQPERDSVGPRVSIPAELPEELARQGFDPVRWAEAYRRTARRFDRLARKAEGMRRDFERVWNGGRVTAEGDHGGSGGDVDRCRTLRFHAEVRDKGEERSD